LIIGVDRIAPTPARSRYRSLPAARSRHLRDLNKRADALQRRLLEPKPASITSNVTRAVGSDNMSNSHCTL